MRGEKLDILTKKPVKWPDLILVAALVLLCILPLALLRREEGAVVEIYRENRLAASLPLDEDADFPYENNGIRNLVRIREGRVCVAEAGCPDKVCRDMGWISKEGEAILCVPSGLKVVVRGVPSDVDSSTSGLPGTASEQGKISAAAAGAGERFSRPVGRREGF